MERVQHQVGKVHHIRSSDRVVRILDTLACNVMFFIATDGMWSPTGSRVVIELYDGGNGLV